MTLGVPKVVWQIPDDAEESWVDLECDLSDILGHMGFPRSLPRSRDPLFHPQIESAKLDIKKITIYNIKFLRRFFLIEPLDLSLYLEK